MMIIGITPLKKGKVQISFDTVEDLVLYKGEVRRFALEERMTVSDDLYRQIYREVIGKRVIKRAMHLLERMDRTEEQLRRKLMEGKYPQDLIEDAIDYVKSYHYIDDERYAYTFIRLNQEQRSAGRMKMDLLSRGIAEDIIERAMAEENETEPETLIRKLLKKKNYDPDTASLKEMHKIYQFLLRKGFQSNEIMHVLKCADYL